MQTRKEFRAIAEKKNYQTEEICQVERRQA